jgi:hypothetical protein
MAGEVAGLGLTVPDFFAVWEAFGDIIRLRAVPRMLAWQLAHPDSTAYDPAAVAALEAAQ